VEQGREAPIGGPTQRVGPSRRERERERRKGESVTGGPGFHIYCKFNYSNRLNLIQSKTGLPKLQKFKTKYGWQVVEIRNNFPYRNFSRFEMDFR
jgi:hypothetical protein